MLRRMGLATVADTDRKRIAHHRNSDVGHRAIGGYGARADGGHCRPCPPIEAVVLR